MKNVPDYHLDLEKLTSRERDIITYIASGFNSNEIADQENISFETVNTHRRNILSKTNCRNMTEVAVKCLQAGLIEVN